jgi:hypothetical protein
MATAWSSLYGRRNPIRRSVSVATLVPGETVTLSVLRRVGEPAVGKLVRDNEQVSVNGADAAAHPQRLKPCSPHLERNSQA